MRESVWNVVKRTKATARRGFTLIELMIVVVIMGVLASLAVYSVSQYIDNAKLGEAREVIGSIMAGQEAYFDETGAYLNVTGGVVNDANYYPVDSAFDGDKMIQWGGKDACVGPNTRDCVDNFKTIGVMVNGAVRFRYASTVFAAGSTPAGPAAVAGYNSGNVKAPSPGYIVVAQTHLTPGGARTGLAGSSMQAQIYSENEGE